jgi:hypothetical protein
MLKNRFIYVRCFQIISDTSKVLADDISEMKRYNTLPQDAQSWDSLDIVIEVKL